MKFSDDPRVDQLLDTRTCPALPSSALEPAWRVIRLLMASRTWGDVGVFTSVLLLPDGRYMAPISGKWAVTFTWLEGTGPRALMLQRV